MTHQAFAAEAIFDGARIWTDSALVLSGSKVSAILARDAVAGPVKDLGAGVLCPGFVDLQVNGGDGVLFNNAPSVETLARMSEAHARIGATSVLPTLITDSVPVTQSAVEAAVAAMETVPGLLGLHLEGPHLDVSRKGAHDPRFLRRMTAEDVAFYLSAALRLPKLKITLSPGQATAEQIKALTRGGVLVSLGHSDCTYEEACAAIDAGARFVTHLFNAMSPLTSRAPGLVGAALDKPVHVGLIADGVHVHEHTLRVALRAKAGGLSRVCLVSDAMAVAGSPALSFTLNGREILRRAGRLTLADGTLAGADLDLADAVARVAGPVGVARAQALAMATAVPAAAIEAGHGIGRLVAEGPGDFLHLSTALELKSVWRDGQRLSGGA